MTVTVLQSGTVHHLQCMRIRSACGVESDAHAWGRRFGVATPCHAVHRATICRRLADADRSAGSFGP